MISSDPHLPTHPPPQDPEVMEPSVSAEVEEEEEPKERKKIHFAVPASAPTNLDPRQVEMVSKAVCVCVWLSGCGFFELLAVCD